MSPRRSPLKKFKLADLLWNSKIPCGLTQCTQDVSGEQSVAETFYSRFICFTLFCFGGRTSLLLTVQGLDEGVSSLSEAVLEYCAGRTHKTQTALMGSCMCKIEDVLS